jgi:hypothetical protein
MKGTTLAGLAVCALTLSAPLAQASTPSLLMSRAPQMKAAAPTANARPHRGDGIRFETEHHHAPGDEISLGGNYYGPLGDAPPAQGPQVIVAPIYVPVEAAPPETPSRGPRIIYIGKETERQRTGFMPQVIYGNAPTHSAGGPTVIYGETIR